MGIDVYTSDRWWNVDKYVQTVSEGENKTPLHVFSEMLDGEG
jgi:hypothetical protein